MPTPLATVSVNVPAAAGVDRRNDECDLDSLSCLDVNGMDVLAGEGGPRVMPRRWFRRWGQRAGYVHAEPQGAGGFSGAYQYAYIWTDGSGRAHYSFTTSAAPSASAWVRVSGWDTAAPSLAGVSIYRTVDGGSVLRLVAAAWTGPYYDDSTPDGALGDAMPAVPAHLDPLGNDQFTQSAPTHLLLPWTPGGSGARRLSVLTGVAGAVSAAQYCEGYPDLDELLRQAPNEIGISAPPDACVFNGRLWVAAGGDQLLVSNGTDGPDSGAAAAGLRGAAQPGTPTFGLAAGPPGPPDTLTAAVGHVYTVQAESLLTGIRSLAATPVDTGAYAARQYNRLTITTAPGSRYHIYRTADGGALYQYVATVAAGASGSVVYDDATPDASLSTQTLPFDVGAPGGARSVWVHKGVLMTAYRTTAGAAAPKLVRWMNTLYPVNFPSDPLRAPSYEMQVDADDGDELVLGRSFGELAILWGRRNLWLISGDPPNYRASRVDGARDLGLVAPRSVVQTPAGTWWLSPAGIALMSSPGAPPRIVSDRIRDVLVETQRDANRRYAVPATREPVELAWWYSQRDGLTEIFHYEVQLSSAPDFGSVDFDWDTHTAGQRELFRVNHRAFPAGGLSLRPGERVRITLRPPEPGAGGPTAGTTYYARARAHDGAEWSAWQSLDDFVRPNDEPWADPLDWSQAQWAFGLHYAPRQEVWFFFPTGGRDWCDTVWVAGYESLLRGGEPTWRSHTLPATAGCVLEQFAVGDQGQQTMMLLASPDGLLFAYPYTHDGYDFDTRVALDANARAVTCTRAKPPPPAGVDLATTEAVDWPLDPAQRYGLAGNLVVARRRANGQTYTGIIASNGRSYETRYLGVRWLAGREPPGGEYDVVIGGVDAYVRSAWFRFGADAATVSLWREAVLKSGPGAGTLDVQVRSSPAGGRPAAGYVTRRRTLAVGRGFEQCTWGVALRGHYQQVRYGSIETGQLWEVRELLAVVEGLAVRA